MFTKLKPCSLAPQEVMMLLVHFLPDEETIDQSSDFNKWFKSEYKIEIKIGKII